MKKVLYLFILCSFVLVTFISTTTATVSSAETLNFEDGLYMEDCYNGNGGVGISVPINYLRNTKFKGKTIYSISLTSYSAVSTPLINMTKILTDYNKRSDKIILLDNNAGCSLASMTILLSYYRDKKNCAFPSDNNNLYSQVVAKSVDNDYKGSGFNPFKIDNVLDDMFASIGSDYTGNNDNLNKHNTIENYVTVKNEPLIISMNGMEPYGSHTVVVDGFETYNVVYKYGIIKKTQKETFYRINTAWARHDYLDKDYMPPIWNICKVK